MTNDHTGELQKALGDQKTLARVAGSKEAKALAQLLKQQQSPQALRQAAEQAAKGDTAQLAALVKSIAANPDGAELMRRLSDSFGGK